MQAGRGTTLRNRSNATSTSTPATPLRSRHEPRRPLPARRPDHRAPGRPRTASALEAISRDTLPHEVAHAIAGPGHRRDAVRQTAARRIGCTAKRSSTIARSLRPRMGECSRCRTRWFRQRLTARVRQRSIRPRRRSRIACRINAREPACRDFSPYNPMIDPMAAGPVERPSADLHRPRGRAAFSAHPPTPVDDTPRGSLEYPTGNTRAPAHSPSACEPGVHVTWSACGISAWPRDVLPSSLGRKGAFHVRSRLVDPRPSRAAATRDSRRAEARVDQHTGTGPAATAREAERARNRRAATGRAHRRALAGSHGSPGSPQAGCGSGSACPRPPHRPADTRQPSTSQERDPGRLPRTGPSPGAAARARAERPPGAGTLAAAPQDHVLPTAHPAGPTVTSGRTGSGSGSNPTMAPAATRPPPIGRSRLSGSGACRSCATPMAATPASIMPMPVFCRQCWRRGSAPRPARPAPPRIRGPEEAALSSRSTSTFAAGIRRVGAPGIRTYFLPFVGLDKSRRFCDRR